MSGETGSKPRSRSLSLTDQSPMAGDQTPIAGATPVASDQTSITGATSLAGNQTPIAGATPMASDQTNMAGATPLASDQTSIAGATPMASDQTNMAGATPMASDQTPIAGATPLASDQTSITGDQTNMAGATPMASDQTPITGDQTNMAGATPMASDQTNMAGATSLAGDQTFMAGDQTSIAGASTLTVDLDRVVGGFVRFLRRGGLVVGISRSIRFRQALGVLGVVSGIDVYWAGRATLVSKPEDITVYDAMFLAFFHHNTSGLGLRLRNLAESLPITADAESDSNEHNDDADTQTQDRRVLRFSAAEVLQDKDFAEFTEAEIGEAQQVMARMRLRPERQLSRRRAYDPAGDRVDLRRTLRRALRTHGETTDIAARSRTTRARRLVLLLDVSGSMQSYARVLIRFAHAAVVGRGRVEVFALGTRLTRMTRELGSHDVDEAVTAAAAAVADWNGGTRLGEGIGRFNTHWGVRGTARAAIVVILSDGWDRGDPAEMAQQMQRLQRVAHRVIWVNPLKAAPGYEPKAQGMAAALPYVDVFVEGHSLRSLHALADIITN